MKSTKAVSKYGSRQKILWAKGRTGEQCQYNIPLPLDKKHAQ
jgi:hypothetical protein